MNKEEFMKLIQKIVEKSNKLKNKYTDELDTPVNYCCIFTQNDKEFEELVLLANQIWDILEETKTWPLFRLNEEIETVAWKLKLLKIRKYDDEHRDLWDADFTINDFKNFKEKYLWKQWFSLIKRPELEMVELMEKWYEVRVYFSFPTLLRKYWISVFDEFEIEEFSQEEIDSFSKDFMKKTKKNMKKLDKLLP